MYAIYKGNIYCMQYTKGIYIVYNVHSFRQNPTKFYKMRHFNVEYCRTYKIEAYMKIIIIYAFNRSLKTACRGRIHGQ